MQCLATTTSSIAVKASTIYESSKLLHLIVGANNTSMTTHGYNYVVRTIVSSDKIARSLARMTVDRGHKKVALIWEQGAYGEDLAYQYRIALDSLGGELVYESSYSHERADFRLPVNELKGVDADMIFFAGLEPWAGDFLRMAREVGIKADIIGAFSDTPEMRARAGAGLEGSMFFDYYDVNSPALRTSILCANSGRGSGNDPDTWAAQGYDALYILAKAVQATGSANPLDLSYAIRFMEPWEGANGSYKFDEQGELEDKPIFLEAYRNGRPVLVEQSHPVPMAQPISVTEPILWCNRIEIFGILRNAHALASAAIFDRCLGQGRCQRSCLRKRNVWHNGSGARSARGRRSASTNSLRVRPIVIPIGPPLLPKTESKATRSSNKRPTALRGFCSTMASSARSQ